MLSLMKETNHPIGSLRECMRRLSLLLLLIPSATISQEIGIRAHPMAQAAADVVREAAGADIAFLAAGLLKESTGDLASIMRYPTDEIVVITLSGAQLKKALERSLSNYPQPNDGFLQISGMTVVFSESAPPESRILEVKVGDALLSAGRQYTAAMPATLARGALGYFKIWDRSQISRNSGQTLESKLKGKTGSVRISRYIAKP